MEDYYWFVLDIKNNKVVNAFEEEYKEDAKEYIEMETEGDKEYRKNFKIISKRTKEKLGYEYPATTKKDAKGGKMDNVGNPTDPQVIEKMEVFIENEIPKLDENIYFTDGMKRKEAKKRFYEKYEYGAYNPKFSFDFDGDDMIEIFPLDKNGDNIKLF
jgi:hypothetical protein